MKRLPKLRLNSRNALVRGELDEAIAKIREIVVAPYLKFPPGIFPIWVSSTAMAAEVAADWEWRTLPHVLHQLPFHRRLLVPVEDGDFVVTSYGSPTVVSVIIDDDGVATAGGIVIPVWRDGLARHPSGLMVDSSGNYYAP